jgi:predicted AAA+ superfamily ATPase
MINFSNIAADAQVPVSTVREYFRILQDTLIATMVPAWKKSSLRKPITTAKFYFFDVGVARHLQGHKQLETRTREYGEAFESYIFHELFTYIGIKGDGSLHYWRSKSNYEVDFILNETTAIEVKAKTNVSNRDLKGIMALQEEQLLKNYVVVSLEQRQRVVNGITIIPWEQFLHLLWKDQFI